MPVIGTPTLSPTGTFRILTAVEVYRETGNAQLQITAADGSSTPFIDFANSSSDDSDARIVLSSDDVLAVQGAVLLADAGLATQRITVTQITANQNNWAPTEGAVGVAATGVLTFSTDASRDITGITAGSDGQWLVLCNSGDFDAVLKHESASSTAANRIRAAGQADVTIRREGSVLMVYDGSTSRWRVIGA